MFEAIARVYEDITAIARAVVRSQPSAFFVKPEEKIVWEQSA